MLSFIIAGSYLYGQILILIFLSLTCSSHHPPPTTHHLQHNPGETRNSFSLPGCSWLLTWMNELAVILNKCWLTLREWRPGCFRSINEDSLLHDYSTATIYCKTEIDPILIYFLQMINYFTNNWLYDKMLSQSSLTICSPKQRALVYILCQN